MTLYLIRHAQSTNNDLYDRTGSSLGRVEDPELTSLGVRQARILADYLAEGSDRDREYGFTHLYTSLMVRSVATATAVSLNEHGWWNRPAETAEQWWQRAKDFLAELSKRHGHSENRVGLVTHGGFYHEVLSALAGGSKQTGVWFTMHNTGITRIDFHSDHASLIYHNRLEHLPPELVS
jgi:2,3-bisphosphoglycerate-dependent phosphoglycerate mutase